MPNHSRTARFFTGLLIVLTILVIAFSLLLPAIHRWGATAEETAQTQPGDELVKNPVVAWTNAININARPEQVWPWVAQLGDNRGGFYSYTFIENMVVGEDIYHNASGILPQFQHPAPGDRIIENTLEIRETKNGEWLLAGTPDGKGWSWLWRLYPLEGGRARMIVRMRVGFDTPSNPVVNFVLDAGGFVMEQNMLQGLKLRAEGGGEPANIETLEILLWTAALLTGLAAAFFFVRRGGWRLLGLGAAAVLWLLVLTFIQPAIWLRFLGDAGLLALLVFFAMRRPAPGGR